VSWRRLRAGEWTALVGAVGLLVVLPMDWFALPLPAQVVARTVGPLHTSGWSSLGIGFAVLLGIVIALGLLLCVLVAVPSAPVYALATATALVVIGAVTLVALVIRVAIVQPGLGRGLPDSIVLVRGPAYLGLLFAALLVRGAWRSLTDERTEAPESVVETPPPLRPAPPAA
jgi:hypothetical protein